jgi:endonuclease/exonuclease/phosphatase family metal-dependent hydrolase
LDRRSPDGNGVIGARSRVRRRAARWGLALVAVLLGAHPAVGDAQAPVRVLSFNIRYGTANDGANAWPNRRAAVLATIEDHAPHLLGLQEALRFQLDELGRGLARYREVGVGRDDGHLSGEYAAILVDTARFTIVDEGTFWLSDTPGVPGSMHWGNRITRITTWVRVVDRGTGDSLRVYNAHWDHESQPSRERSAALLLERLRASPFTTDAVLVMGDFNSGPLNPAFVTLTTDPRTPLRDVHRSLATYEQWGGTFNGFKGDRSGEKIDAILASPAWRVLDAGIDRRRWGSLWASDHFAVWGALSLRRKF